MYIFCTHPVYICFFGGNFCHKVSSVGRVCLDALWEACLWKLHLPNFGTVYHHVDSQKYQNLVIFNIGCLHPEKLVCWYTVIITIIQLSLRWSIVASPSSMDSILYNELHVVIVYIRLCTFIGVKRCAHFGLHWNNSEREVWYQINVSIITISGLCANEIWWKIVTTEYHIRKIVNESIFLSKLWALC